MDGLCASCRAAVAAIRPCAHCATFIHANETEHYRCSTCRGESNAFVLARAAAPYGGRLRDNLLDLKYRGRAGLRRPLAALLLLAYQKYYAALSFDVVTPVALHPQRRRERGYNQAELLSELLAAELGLEHDADLLSRVKDTPSQAGSGDNARQRRLTMRGAITAAPTARERRVLLIDDIYTTGATCAAAALALQRRGAASVHVLTVAAGRDL